MLTGDVRAYLPGVCASPRGGRPRRRRAPPPGTRRQADLPARRPRLPNTPTPTSDATPSACCGASRPTRFAGSRVALVNADYRWPIARPQRGVGTWPVFLHTVHAAVFADAGHAWTRTFDAGAIKYSAGAELSAESRRRLLDSVRGDDRRRVGPRRQRTAPRPRDGVFSRRHGVLAAGRLLRADR